MKERNKKCFKNAFLHKTLMVTLCMVAISSVSVQALIQGDLNNDGVVDAKDLALMSQYYNKNYSAYDLNKDGIIDIQDIVKLTSNFAQREPVKAVVKNTLLNLRPEPDRNISSKIDIPGNTPVSVIGRTKGFYILSYEASGKTTKGYVTRFLDILQDTPSSTYLGYLSELYEVGAYRGPETISTGIGDAGGKSYGPWQLSSKVGSLTAFILWLKDENKNFYDKLNNGFILDNNSFNENFDKAWIDISNEYYDEFYTIQHKYIKINYYDLLLKYLKSVYDFEPMLNKSFTMRNVFWSTGVQHGAMGAKNILSKFTDKTDEVDLINAIYEERAKVDIYFKNASEDVKKGLLIRFEKEKEDALRALNYEKQYLK